MIGIRVAIKRLVRALWKTPLHPQWLLGSRSPMLHEVAAISGGRVLDIGCADAWPRKLLPATCHYIGLDYPLTGAELYGAHPDIFADAGVLPIADQIIDVVLAFEVVEHLRCPREALQEVARVLKPNGKLLMTMPFLYPIHDAPYDFQRYTAHGLVRELEAVGLKLIELKPSLGTAETGGLIANLALGGIMMGALNKRHPSVVLLPLILPLVPLINLVAWALGKLLPTWPALIAGYQLRAAKE